MSRPSLAELFGLSKPAPQQQAAPQQQSNAPATSPVQKTPDNPAEPGFQKSPGQNPTEQTPTEPSSPIDEFKDLFTMDEPKEGEVQDDPNAPFFTLDPTKLQEQVSKQKFVDANTMAELATKATQGDVNSLMDLVNAVAQQTFIKAADYSTAVANRTAASAYDRTTKQMPDKFKDFMSRQSVEELNPAFLQPGMAPMVNAIRQQISSKFPTASPKEIANMTNKYLTTVATTLTAPQQQAQNQQQNAADTEWNDFFAR